MLDLRLPEEQLLSVDDVDQDTNILEMAEYLDMAYDFDRIVEIYGEQNKLEVLVINGFPDHLRGTLWSKLAGCDFNSVNNGVLVYENMCKKSLVPCASDIEKDITRTFATHSYFKDSESGPAALYRVLCAATVYDPVVGYCQGMGYIAGLMLLHVPERHAFTLFTTVLSRYGLRELFQDGMAKLDLLFPVIEKDLAKHTPRFLRLFSEELGGMISSFASPWLLTVFSACYNDSPDIVLRIWDLFLIYGWKAIVQVAVAIIKLREDELLNFGGDLGGILDALKVILPRDITPKQLLQTALSIESCISPDMG